MEIREADLGSNPALSVFLLPLSDNHFLKLYRPEEGNLRATTEL